MENHYKFWMIVGTTSRSATSTRKHDTLESAEAECIRLVQKENAPFYILEATRRCEPEKIPVKWIDTVETEH